MPSSIHGCLPEAVFRTLFRDDFWVWALSGYRASKVPFTTWCPASLSALLGWVLTGSQSFLCWKRGKLKHKKRCRQREQKTREWSRKKRKKKHLLNLAAVIILFLPRLITNRGLLERMESGLGSVESVPLKHVWTWSPTTHMRQGEILSSSNTRWAAEWWVEAGWSQSSILANLFTPKDSPSPHTLFMNRSYGLIILL